MDYEVRKSILQTLIYSDIFDYPLSKNELWKFFTGEKVDEEFFEGILKNLKKEINFRDGFYFLSGRDKIIKTRIKRGKESKKKILIAKKIIKRLSYIPTIQFIGISGALALENSGRDDDIDLFVITSKGSLWLTRLTMIILLLLMGRYRRRNQRNVSDKICLNMLIDESALSFLKLRQNLYIAHEIAQLMPIFERNIMYKRFIAANQWVEKFLPNAMNGIKNQESFDSAQDRSRIKNKQKRPLLMIHNSLFIFEHFAKIIQLWFITKHITTETINDNFLAFHPIDYKEKVLNEYKKRLKLYEI